MLTWYNRQSSFVILLQFILHGNTGCRIFKRGIKNCQNLIEEYQFKSTFFVIGIFDSINFQITSFSKMMPNF